MPGVVHAETEGTFTDWRAGPGHHRAVPVGGAAQEIWDLAGQLAPASGSTSGSLARPGRRRNRAVSGAAWLPSGNGRNERITAGNDAAPEPQPRWAGPQPGG